MKLTPKDQLKLLRAIDVLQEIWISLHLIQDGFAILQRTKYANGSHYSFMILIATGLERLYKIILTTEEYETKGQFLFANKLKGYGHDLLALNEAVLRICHAKHPSFDVTDLEEPENKEILKILADFLGDSKYLYLDSLNDPREVRNEPRDRWNELGFNIHKDHQAPLLKLELIVRLLCKLLSEIYLPGKVKGFSPMIRVFLDHDPGKTVYNEIQWGPIIDQNSTKE